MMGLESSHGEAEPNEQRGGSAGSRWVLVGFLAWRWDGRLGTALADLPLEKRRSVLGILEQYLICRWDRAAIGEAPEVAQNVKCHLGGLMAAHLLSLRS